MAVIPADNREMYMDTKPFTNMFGSEVEVSRDEFVKRWTDELFKFTQLFYATENEYQKVYNEMVYATEQLAGQAWDRK